MQEKELLSAARVAQPQLVTFYQELDPRPKDPFVDPLEARHWIAGVRN
jgi:hypothetical protein